MNKKKAMKKIDELFVSADDIGIKLIEVEARKILAADPNLDEFIMAMGSCFFTIKEGGKYDINTMTDEEWDDWTESEDYVHEYNGIVDDVHFQKEFFDMVADLNERFNSMGCPMRFTATSNIVTDWGDTRKDPVKYTEMKKPTKYLVEGDHPVFRRIFDIYDDEHGALLLIKEMKEFNYENITLNGKEM